MKLMKAIGCLSLLLLLQVAPAAAQSARPLTNSDVLMMLKDGLPPDVVVAKINTSHCDFDTSVSALEALKAEKVPSQVILAMVSSSTPSDVMARTATQPVAPKPAGNHADGIVIPDGTAIKLKFAQTVSSATAHVNDEVPFQVMEPVRVHGVVVIAGGAQAMGTVTTAKKKGHFGHGGKLNINIDWVRDVAGDRVTLRAVQGGQGGGHTGAMTGLIVASAVVLPIAAPFFLFMHGKDITYPEGAMFTAFTSGDTTVGGGVSN